MTARQHRMAGWTFRLLGGLICLSVIADVVAQAFGSPPMDEDRVTRLIDGLVWVYVGQLNMSIANLRDEP